MQANGTVNLNEWHHITSTYDGSNTPGGMHIYIDGSDQALTVLRNNLTHSVLNNKPLHIGVDDIPGSFAGMIDDVRVYNRVLSASEVQQLYYATGGQ
jgi:hypothetical protein